MKKIFYCIICLILIFSLTACAAPMAPVCQHRDADDNNICDKTGCGQAYTDGKDIPDAPICQHRDANDDGLCDVVGCGGIYKDGIDAHICQHRDADDNGICDKTGCGEAYTDGKDIPDTPVCQHRDTDDNGTCDNAGCGEAYTDGTDVFDPECPHGDKDGDGKCDECMPYTREGNYIYFGEYPQTIKGDDVTIMETQDARGYYLGSDGSYYAQVVATPYGRGYTFSSGATVSKGETYYFKVEPIRWKILSTNDETAFLLCDSIIANMAYQSQYTYDSTTGMYYTTANGAPNGTHMNSYEYSEVRQWLNSTFYETAFDVLQKEAILVYATNRYGDKISLPSQIDIGKDYGFEDPFDHDLTRRRSLSDYTRATGACMEEESGKGEWWILTDASGIIDSNYSFYVNYAGYAYVLRGSDCSFCGVVPALWIRL